MPAAGQSVCWQGRWALLCPLLQLASLLVSTVSLVGAITFRPSFAASVTLPPWDSWSNLVVSRAWPSEVEAQVYAAAAGPAGLEDLLLYSESFQLYVYEHPTFGDEGECCCDSHARSWVLTGPLRRSPVGRGGRPGSYGRHCWAVTSGIRSGLHPDWRHARTRAQHFHSGPIRFGHQPSGPLCTSACPVCPAPRPCQVLPRIAQSSRCLASPRLLQQRGRPHRQSHRPGRLPHPTQSVANLAVQLQTLASALPALTARLEEMDARQQDLALVISVQNYRPWQRRSWVHPRLCGL